tara:strand:- start:90 stop:200 length:111 start_codon:yes stop_codon:yes gene_type:complete
MISSVKFRKILNDIKRLPEDAAVDSGMNIIKKDIIH